MCFGSAVSADFGGEQRQRGLVALLRDQRAARALHRRHVVGQERVGALELLGGAGQVADRDSPAACAISYVQPPLTELVALLRELGPARLDERARFFHARVDHHRRRRRARLNRGRSSRLLPHTHPRLQPRRTRSAERDRWSAAWSSQYRSAPACAGSWQRRRDLHPPGRGVGRITGRAAARRRGRRRRVGRIAARRRGRRFDAAPAPFGGRRNRCALAAPLGGGGGEAAFAAPTAARGRRNRTAFRRPRRLRSVSSTCRRPS